MTTNPLVVQISVILNEPGRLSAVYETDRVSSAYNENSLVLEPHQSVIFEITDFMADGNTYRVNARTRSVSEEWSRWPRQSGGCRSPMFADPITFEIEITATPASAKAATTSTTSTTVITKKGRPDDLSGFTTP